MIQKLPDFVSQTIFRANDIRGKVDTVLTPDVVYAVGLAFGSEAMEQKQKRIVIARDGRISSPRLSRALAQGLMQSGVDAIDIGAVPTPLMYFATHALDSRSGIMVTGSHNPKDENGLKLVLNSEVLTEAQLSSLYDRIKNKSFSKGNGQLEEINIVEKYCSKVQANVILEKPLRIVVDCGNGIAGDIFPELARRLGCEVIELYCDVDGNFPNHFPDPSVAQNLEALIASVQEHKADVGIAFDGDGDRLGTVDNKGRIVWPDRQLMLFAQQVLKEDANAKIVYDVKCTRLLDPWVRKHSGTPIMWKTGHSLIKAKLKEENAKLAGEMSGHFYFNDRWYGFDDGLYAGARLLEILANDKASADELFSSIPDSVNTPELRLPMPDEKKFQFMNDFEHKAIFKNGRLTNIDGVRVDFDFGFGLVRASNTSPNLILRFEADTKDDLERIKDSFRTQLHALEPNLELPF